MFRSFIYLDEDKLYTYKRQIDGKNDVQPKAVSQKKTAGFSAAVSGFGLNGATETSIDDIQKKLLESAVDAARSINELFATGIIGLLGHR